MEYEVNYSSIKPMLDIISDIKVGKDITEDIKQLLEHKDYEFEFSRYENRINKEEFIDYIKNINYLEEEDIKNIDLKVHHKYYKDLIENIEFYTEKINELQSILKDDRYREVFTYQLELALKGLPTDFKLPKLNFIFTIGIGQSFGYAHNNGIHFDFLKLVKENDLSKFISIIGHEVHHVALNIIEENRDFNKLTVEEFFYLCFTGEGLAVKYCNNASGIISKPIYGGEVNIGLDKYTWDYLNNDFDNTFKQFKSTIQDIRNGVYKNIDELMVHIKDYWMSPYTAEQTKGEIPKLQHFRLYSFGNDIWGVIHDVFGKDVVYETFRNPNKFIKVYNESVKTIGRNDLIL